MAKSILEEALLQVSQLEEAVKNNAKEILASTMKQEIDELVRESMEEPQIEEADDNEEVMETAEEVSEETTEVAETELEEQFEEEDEDDDSEESEESEDEMEGDMEMGPEMEDEGESDMEDIDMPMLDLPSLDDEGDEDEVIDMTGASDEEILKVFKSMGEEDGIIVSQDEDGTVHLEDGDDEYRIEVNESEESEEVAEEEVEESMEDELSEESDEEVVYEIEIDETEEVADEVIETEEEVAEEVTETEEIEDEEETPEADMEEASRTHAADARVPSNQGKKYKAGRADLSEELDTLKAKNTELTEALKVFRDKLNEVGVFNANLAYATRLFTEHTTTKQEKLNILKRFDGIESLKESKALYNSIKNELTASDNKLTETVVNKISSSPQSGSSEKLVEAKTYENPQIRRIKEMMGIVK
jgi:S-DNA-T family DNA segregation ATPase FtsK/SpoIIIE